jgi:hypothetical protein
LQIFEAVPKKREAAINAFPSINRRFALFVKGRTVSRSKIYLGFA